MKIIKLISSIEALNVLSEKKLSAKASFKLGIFLKKATPEIEAYNKTKNEKIVTYGVPIMKKDSEGKDTAEESGQFSFTKENADKYVEEMKEIEDMEVEAEVPEIKLSDLGSVEIEPKHLIALDWLIVE